MIVHADQITKHTSHELQAIGIVERSWKFPSMKISNHQKFAIPSIYYRLLKVGGYHLSMPCHAGSCLCNASTRSWRRKRARTKRKESPTREL